MNDVIDTFWERLKKDKYATMVDDKTIELDTKQFLIDTHPELLLEDIESMFINVKG